MIMARVYSNYSNQELNLIKKESEAKGLSVSAYQKYCTLLSLKKDNKDIAELIAEMRFNLSKKNKPGDLFIVSSLVDENEWSSLERGEKITMAKQLKKIVNENPKKYRVNAVLPGRITQYVVLDEEA